MKISSLSSQLIIIAAVLASLTFAIFLLDVPRIYKYVWFFVVGVVVIIVVVWVLLRLRVLMPTDLKMEK